MKNSIIKEEYKVEKSKEENKWLIVRYSETKRGCNIGKVFEGKRKECIEKLKQIKEDKNERNNKK